jgi:hypothetical protein
MHRHLGVTKAMRKCTSRPHELAQEQACGEDHAERSEILVRDQLASIPRLRITLQYVHTTFKASRPKG